MEERINSGRGGSWKRGGTGGRGTEVGCSGEQHKSRGGRGKQRGRGKRDHYRGRGRGGGASASNFSRDNCDELELQDEEMEKMFPRRKLESNWDRYEEPEKEEGRDGVPTRRGTDYRTLIETAGSSYSQFRFSDETEWETDSFAASMLSAIPLDLEALAQQLEQLPQHERLNLGQELVEGQSTVTDPPSVTLALKQDLLGQTSLFKPPAPALKGPGVSLGLASAGSPRTPPNFLGSSVAAEPYEVQDEELDQLLGLKSPYSEPPPVSVEEVPAASPAETPEVSQGGPSPESKGKEADATAQEGKKKKKMVPVQREVTEEDLEDWLDSMIS